MRRHSASAIVTLTALIFVGVSATTPGTASDSDNALNAAAFASETIAESPASRSAASLSADELDAVLLSPVLVSAVPAAAPLETTTTETTTAETSTTLAELPALDLVSEGLPSEPELLEDLEAPLPVPAPAPTQSYFDEPIVDLGHIQIPSIGINLPMGEGISLDNIDRGPSHWPGAAMPGEMGNAVIAGHRVTRGAPFRDIDQLVNGDEVIFLVNGTRSVYEVFETEVVTPNGLHILDQTRDYTATLFACHPPGSARFRYVVKLRLVESTSNAAYAGLI